jgi:LPXTG-site transpeptidase (sortase) family protein
LPKWLLLLVAPLALIAVAAGVACDGGEDEEPQASAPTRTPGPTKTPVPPTPTWKEIYDFLVAITPPTPTPAPSSGGGGGGGGGAARPSAGSYQPRPAGTGPGAIVGTDMTISIPSASINASVYARSVGTNGQMGNPAGAWDVIWYDFAQNFPGLGGRPGEPGANAVFAGHVDYIRVGPAVFWNVRNLKAGDQIVVNTANGPFTYRVEWTQWAGPYEDFTKFVAKAGAESVTLVTCIGEFSGGHYSNRFVVRAVRI